MRMSNTKVNCIFGVTESEERDVRNKKKKNGDGDKKYEEKKGT